MLKADDQSYDVSSWQNDDVEYILVRLIYKIDQDLKFVFVGFTDVPLKKRLCDNIIIKKSGVGIKVIRMF